MKGKILVGLIRLLSWLPLPLNHAVGAAVGRSMLLFSNRMTRYARTNIAACLPELSEEARRVLLRRSMIEAGKTFTEMGALWLGSRERVMGMVREIRGIEALDAVLAEGRGVIMATPHLGSWEMGGLYCASRWPMTTLYRPPRVAELEPLLLKGRGHTGARLVRTDAAGVRALLQTLKAGEVAGILPDQDPPPGNGTFAPFFGIPAHTMVLLSKLERKSGAALFIGYAERLPRGRGFRLHYHPVPGPAEDESLEQAVARLNAAVESVVRELPEQYQWGYRRFKTRPEGEPPFYT